MKTLKKLASIIITSILSFAFAIPALADVVMDPFYALHKTDGWAIWVAIGIALIALAILWYLVLRARRNK